MKTDSRKLGRSMASLRSRSCISLRPCFQVIISVNISAPIRSGNQPPSSTLTMLAARKAKSTMKKKPVARITSDHGYFQA